MGLKTALHGGNSSLPQSDLLHRQRRLTGRHMLIDLLHLLHKDLPVLRHLDGGHRRAQNLNLVLLQDTLLGQLHAAVQSCLSAEG